MNALASASASVVGGVAATVCSTVGGDTTSVGFTASGVLFATSTLSFGFSVFTTATVLAVVLEVVLSDEEVDRIIAATTSQRDKAILELFYATGCLSAELIDMDRQQWEAVELVDPEYMIWQIWVIGKNRKYRPVCLHNRAKVAVDRYLKTRTDCFRPLFISGQRGRITYSTVDKMLKSAAERAEITKRVSQHTLRHSYATKMASNGMPVPTLSYNLGHANGTVTQRVYVHINSFQAAKSYARCQNES